MYCEVNVESKPDVREVLKEGENLMKKKTLLASLLVLLLSLALYTGVALADKPVPVGERIILYGDPITFPAGEPFHIQHGFFLGNYMNERVGNSRGLSVMILEVDGVEVPPSYVTTDWGAAPKDPENPGKGGVKLFTFNFPDGMSGTHTFVRRYFFTCQSFWDQGIELDCKNPAELIEFPPFMTSLEVTFE